MTKQIGRSIHLNGFYFRTKWAFNLGYILIRQWVRIWDDIIIQMPILIEGARYIRIECVNRNSIEERPVWSWYGCMACDGIYNNMNPFLIVQFSG